MASKVFGENAYFSNIFHGFICNSKHCSNIAYSLLSRMLYGMARGKIFARGFSSYSFKNTKVPWIAATM